MPLPDLIEISPLGNPVQAEITVPGSKSITNRALILAALGGGQVTLEGALWSEDTQVMVECLQRLGFRVGVETDPREYCNRFITVRGRGGEIPNGGTEKEPLELFVGNAGTAARFLAAMVCLGRGVYRLSGVPRMHQRPQAALFTALRDLGYRIDSENNKLPAVIHGTGPRAGQCRVSIDESSQFASALILSGEVGGWTIETVSRSDGGRGPLTNAALRSLEPAEPEAVAAEDEMPYVTMTTALRSQFPRHGGQFLVEPDASSGSYFWATPLLDVSGGEKKTAEALKQLKPKMSDFMRSMVAHVPTGVSVAAWPKTGWQVDQRFPEVIFRHPVQISRRTDLGDSIMTAIAIAPLSAHETRFTDLGRLRLQECERVEALRTELTKCGAEVLEQGDTLTVFPSASKLHGAEIETYHDHRMAMCFAVLGLSVPGIKLRDPSCVKKTFPNFFQKLAAAPPRGLGVAILDGRTGRNLQHGDLFAA